MQSAQTTRAIGRHPASRPGAPRRSKGRGGPTPVDAYVGNRVKQRCRALGITQKELAQRLGIGYTRLQLYVHGAVRISAGLLHDIARVLEVPIDYFYAGLGAVEQPAIDDLEMTRRLSTSEANQLVHAFLAIDDEAVRRSVLELCERVASHRGPQGEPEPHGPGRNGK